MPSPAVLDIPSLIAPCSAEKPVGEDPRNDPSPTSLYYKVKDARSAARAIERQQITGDDDSGNPPDWRPVVENAKALLTKQAKDLEITAYLIEALVRLNGFAGLRDGFQLTRELIEKYWDGLFPLPDEEGIDTRVAPLTGLNGDDAEGTLIAPISRVPLTDNSSIGRMSLSHYQEAVATGKIADAKARDRKIAQGAKSMDMIQKAVSESSPKFFVNLVEDLTQCQEEFTKLCMLLDERCGSRSPPSSQIRTALGSCLDVVKDVARAKLAAAAPKAEPAKGEAGAAAAGAEAQAGGPAGPGEAMDVLRTREDAFRVLGKIVEFFHRTEPQSIVSFALEQVIRWGQTPLPDLLTELIPDEAPRKNLFKQVGIKLPEPPPKEADKKK